MISPALTIDQELRLAASRLTVKDVNRKELEEMYLFLLEQYFLVDNHRTVLLAMTLLGVPEDDTPLLKFQQTGWSTKTFERLEFMRTFDETGEFK